VDNALGDAIRNARVAASMTQAALAKELGVSRQTVSGWEAGRYRPQRRLLDKLGDVLGLRSETGFPWYWPDRRKTPEENCREQLRAFKARQATPPV